MCNERKIDLLFEACKKAANEDEIPISCMIVNLDTNDYRIFYNQKEKIKSILGHAEILAIKYGNQINKDFRLNNFEIIVTTEPCIMCLGAIIESRISKLTILSRKEKNELFYMDKYINSSSTLIQYCEKNEFKEVIKKFFENKRSVI